MEHVYNYSTYDAIFFRLSEYLLQKKQVPQNKRKHRTPTPEGGCLYTVKHVGKTHDGDTILVCTNKALLAQINVRVLEVHGDDHPKGSEKAQAAKQLLSSWLQKAQNIEVITYYLKHEHHKHLGSLYANGQNIGDMLLEQGLAQPDYGKDQR